MRCSKPPTRPRRSLDREPARGPPRGGLTTSAGLSPESRESIFTTIAMATSIDIPKPLLEAVDRKARALKMSRNRLIVRALERELTSGSDWSPGFFEQLKAVDAETAAAVDELLVAVREARRSKPPRHL